MLAVALKRQASQPPPPALCTLLGYNQHSLQGICPVVRAWETSSTHCNCGCGRSNKCRRITTVGGLRLPRRGPRRRRSETAKATGARCEEMGHDRLKSMATVQLVVARLAHPQRADSAMPLGRNQHRHAPRFAREHDKGPAFIQLPEGRGRQPKRPWQEVLGGLPDSVVSATSALDPRPRGPEATNPNNRGSGAPGRGGSELNSRRRDGSGRSRPRTSKDVHRTPRGTPSRGRRRRSLRGKDALRRRSGRPTP